MAETIPSAIPDAIRAGDTVKWDNDWTGDFPPSEGYTAFYEFLNSSGTIDAQIQGVNSNDVWRFTIPAATSAAWAAGTVYYIAYAKKSGDRFTKLRGTVQVRADLEVATTADERSHVKKVLDAIEATLEGTASRADASYSVEGRSLSRRSLDELVALRQKYKALYTEELRKLAIEKGEGHSGKVRVRFN